MSETILHHYPTSPFSEKVRLLLGMKGLRWRSVHVPVIMPKPDVVALTGGYRRTPFLQIGADVYCDSLLMCRVIDRMAPDPPLYPAPIAGLAEIVAQWADSTLFWAAVPFTMQPAGAAHLFAGAPPEALKAFAADRAAMNPSMRRAPTADARAALLAYLDRLASLLADGRKFLLGGVASIADVSAAQSIWFMRRAPPIAALLAPYPGVVAWFERVAAFGHGEATPMGSDEAIAVAASARNHAPTSVAAGQPFAAGAEVAVTAADYAHDEIVGTVVGLDDAEVVLARDDPRAGRVHVHFPRIGFHIKATKKEIA
ncbi:MAG TPA: glutathione S-transferase family protein [Caldimonas sp.]|nr:glutathione S-transferase family protein [Caldimonas sp.]HEX4234908.1 glutathione S-transferase family protein [Caldimonas sp.]